MSLLLSRPDALRDESESVNMRIASASSPPPLSLPQDPDDLANSSQPPLCTPIDQPVQRADTVTASPVRAFAKRRRTLLNPVPPLELPSSLPANTGHRPRSQLPRPPNPSVSLTEDDSQPANSQSFSQRDLPDMSQDTLALFPNIVRDLQGSANSNSCAAPVPNTTNLQPSDNGPPRLPHFNKDFSASLAKASMLSTLSGSEALCNPFLAYPRSPPECHHPSPLTPSFRQLGAEIPVDESVGTTDTPDKSRNCFSPKRARRKLDEEKLLKLLIVSCSQGRKLSLDFVIRGLAGKGAFSQVFKVTHRLDGTTYAVKKNLFPMNTYHARKDAVQEVFALSALQDHPNIIRYHDAWFEEKGHFLFIQTEFFSAGSLYSLFIQQRRPMSADELFYLASDMSHALSHIHDQGIVHLDVKPDNVFQSNRGRQRASYVIGDFGLACHKEGCDARSTEGDARYLCPEALQETSFAASGTTINSDGSTQKSATWDLRARDVFSLGVTMYELGTGVPLEKNSDKQRGSQEALSGMAAEVGRLCGSAIIEDIVKRCLEPDPKRRATAGEIQTICSSHGSLDAVAKKEAQERHLRETEQKLEDCKAYLRSLLKKGEAGRDEFRREHQKGSALAHSRVMSL